MAADRVATLISIKPRFARQIFSGRKSFELRRRFPNLPTGSLAYVYSSTPDRQILGSFIIGEVISEDLGHLWSRVKKSVGLQHVEFSSYFQDLSAGTALRIQDAHAMPRPVSLLDLRRRVGVEPPQSYRYLDANQCEILTLLGGERSAPMQNDDKAHQAVAV